MQITTVEMQQFVGGYVESIDHVYQTTYRAKVTGIEITDAGELSLELDEPQWCYTDDPSEQWQPDKHRCHEEIWKTHHSETEPDADGSVEITVVGDPATTYKFMLPPREP